MSSTLKWDPIIDRGIALSDELKYILQVRFGKGFDINVSVQHLDYLRGLRDGIKEKEIKKEIQTLIDAIKKYEAITLWEDY